MTTEPTDAPMRFGDFALAPPVLEALSSIGYESPSPIQSRTIPLLLEGRDVLGQAQTGTGKTAAFALPILTRIDVFHRVPQALVLAPTRELAIQVAEAFQKYGAGLQGFHVLPIYGGQSYEPQIKGLKRGAQVIVGTPGRVVDHIKRGMLKLDAIRFLVLDEADEMLRMGFIEDVEWVLQQTPPDRNTALFSATMPSQIRRVATTYLRDPAEVTIKSKTTTGANIRQRYWLVSGLHKLDALTRFLEIETFEAMLVFVRTKAATIELAEKLEARGFSASPLNGDLQQSQRERIVARLKDGGLDIVVATDVAARGLDVERITHVVNYDIPTDTESYVHRIGRTGRAGRSGEAILFVSPRERHLLKAIERATRQPIEAIAAPSIDVINAKRLEKFQQSIGEALEASRATPEVAAQLDVFRNLVVNFEQESGTPLADIAAALASMVHGTRPLLLPSVGALPASAGPVLPEIRAKKPPVRSEAPPRPAPVEMAPVRTPPARAAEPPRRAEPIPSPHPVSDARPDRKSRRTEPVPSAHPVSEARPERKPNRDREKMPDDELETYRVEVGRTHGVKPGNLVGAIANEAGLDSANIGKIEIFEDFSHVDLPVGMPKKIFKDLQKVWVSSRQLRISLVPKMRSPRSSSR